MTFIGLGFITGFSLILAIGAQNIFVIEQGIKKQFVFIVCLICAVSDLLLIFTGIFLFEYFQNFFNQTIELIFNLLLLLFLLYFIISKFREKHEKINFCSSSASESDASAPSKDNNSSEITTIIRRRICRDASHHS